MTASASDPAPADPAAVAAADPTAGLEAGLADVVAALRAAGCVFAEDEAALLAGAAQSPAELADLARRRAAGLPIEHVVGWADFCGLRVRVDPGVFVPRPRSELLVREAAARCGAGATIVDLACGCGAIGLAVATMAGSAPAGSAQARSAQARSNWANGGELHAVDIDPVAVACARRNLAGVGGLVYQGDLYQPLPGRLRGQVELLVANVPYVPSAEVAFLPPEARIHEPLVALDGGTDGLAVLRLAVAGAGDWLADGGHLLIEVSARQADAALAAFAATGLTATVAADPELGATVVIGQR